MKIRAFVFVFGISLLASASALTASAAQTTCLTQRCQGLRSDFRFAANTADQIYCYLTEKTNDTHLNFKMLAMQMEATIFDSTTDNEFYNLMRRWAASFHDGHVNLMPSEKGPSIFLPSSDLKFEVLAPATLNEKVIISKAGTDLSLPGSEVISLNNVPVKMVMNETEKLASGSTPRMRRFGAARRLIDGWSGAATTSAVQILVRDALGGSRFITTQIRQAQVSPAPAPGSVPEPSTVSASILPGNIGYLRIDGFTGANIRQDLNQAMDRIDNTVGLLIDVRKNGGGDQSGDEVLARLILAPMSRYEISPRLSMPLLRERPEFASMMRIAGTDFGQWTPQTVRPAMRGHGWAGKAVAVLSSTNCFSACDTFVSALQANGLAEVVGEATGGGTGSPHVFELPFSHHKFRYSVVRGRTANQELIEGTGTLPEFAISPTQLERRNGQDEQLKTAIQHLLQRVQSQNTGVLGFQPESEPDANLSKSLATIGELQIRSQTAAEPSSELSATQEETLQLQREMAAQSQ